MAIVNLIITLKDGSFTGALEGNIKFPADAFTHEDGHFFLLMNGLNYRFSSSRKEDNIQYFINNYEESGDTFFKDFRGSFCVTL